MAQSFSVSFRGYNQEEVTSYLEFMNNQYRMKLDQIGDEIAALTARCIRAEEASSAASRHTDAEFAALEEKLSAASIHLADLLSSYENLHTRHQEAVQKLAGMGTDGEEVLHLREELVRLKDENSRLQAQLDSRPAARSFEQVQAEFSAYLRQNPPMPSVEPASVNHADLQAQQKAFFEKYAELKTDDSSETDPDVQRIIADTKSVLDNLK